MAYLRPMHSVRGPMFPGQCPHMKRLVAVALAASGHSRSRSLVAAGGDCCAGGGDYGGGGVGCCWHRCRSTASLFDRGAIASIHVHCYTNRNSCFGFLLSPWFRICEKEKNEKEKDNISIGHVIIVTISYVCSMYRYICLCLCIYQS